MGDRLFEEWRVYEKLLIHDYMDHRAFFNRLQAEILSRYKHPVAILDLGCGDLSPILPMLAELSIKCYVGIDESDAALGIAAGRLQEAGIPGRLVRGDLLAEMKEVGETFDVVLASFSLHHLADPMDKRRVLEAGRQLLNPGGLFALVDVFCTESESRDSYLERWVGHADAHYAALRDAEKQLLFDHVRARDFPVSLATFQALGKQAGLARFEVLLKDSEELNCLVTFAPTAG